MPYDYAPRLAARARARARRRRSLAATLILLLLPALSFNLHGSAASAAQGSELVVAQRAMLAR